MSVNRNRKGRRAYLKHVSSRHDPNPQPDMKAAIGLGRDINPINALPHRARLWLDKNKHTPTMTEPMRERVESWRIAMKDQRTEYHTSLVDTPLQRIQLCTNSIGSEVGCFWFKKLNRITGVELESFRTYTHTKAMAWYHEKRIPWK